jgi:16S rRNA (uracil1498-N3)-methyltransferase
MQLFYAPDIADEKKYILSQEESAHAVGVLRYKKGQNIILTDGRGYFYDAIIEDTTRKQVSVSIVNKYQKGKDRFCRLHIAIAPTKSIERFEWFLEKATEIGIDEISPIITGNSERKHIRNERLEKIIIAAIKQSVKAYLPKLNPLMKFDDFLGSSYPGYRQFIAHCGTSNRDILRKAYTPLTDALILVGPEGDFTPEEIRKAVNNGFNPISLGNSRLRTETAGVVACHTIYVLNQK